ncbi:Na+/H+ antiporter NhaC [Pseudomarimonas salicorniae]|uniref:Na+/H+ antiporter NhaC n=1 Tax=Pseudomarimonas salicorniae TaxID=2933270 RepID=A0ABT0GLJ8_9GAMM|nr:Na+/H+ antiporter NhaC [Lysobacter sp. CAU 1642]MCK7595417.1 Na+/H+ antiporter NhaC [Lysobacter sp. CAU 1642]
MSESSTPRAPSLLQALIPLLALVLMLGGSVWLFSDSASAGPNQIALLLCACLAGIIGLRNGLGWKDIEEAMVSGVTLATSAVFILLAVGALIGTWILSGTVPTMIYYGIQIMDPSWFYPATCFVCALVALTIGSSWTVAGTLGVALIGVAHGLELSPAITAGAVISGAYFGDKLSPLSDTTNLAPAAAGSELFAHVRNMTWTTVPSIVLALIGFAILGAGVETRSGAAGFGELPTALAQQFTLGWHLLLPLLLVFGLAVARVPAFPTILIGALTGAVFAVIFQPDLVVARAGNEALDRGWAMLAGAWLTLADGYTSESGVKSVDELLSRGGMSSMLNTIWLILCAMAFGAVMERTGLLERLIRGVLGLARSTGALISATLGTALGSNILAADQYMSIVLTGRIYRPEYERRGLHPLNLSRALEDAGTLTSPLVPWNTCGAYMAATLGVATLDYLPFALFNLINPLVAVVFAYAGFKILRIQPEAQVQQRA